MSCSKIDYSVNLSGEQIAAGNKLVCNFEKGKVFWCILLAQMQSGKTGAYLFVAAEMLRLKKIKKVIVLCGCNETELKTQMNDSIREFEYKYRTYLMNEYASLPEHERGCIIQDIFKKGTFSVKSGNELDAKHAAAEVTDTLLIWDESHYAAAKSNRPNKFLERLGIRADGSSSCLAPNNNFVLSVSATPYAELTDLQGEKQEKLVVNLNPGKGYKGVGHYLTNEKIVGFTKWQTKLSEILSSQFADVKNKYGVVRVQGDAKMQEAIRIATECGWECKTFDSEVWDIDSMNELDIAPVQNTVVFIRGMCRMGKVVPKQHIAFVMETATNSKTDALLQGLLGRVCGYGIDNDIYIYINNGLLAKKTGATEESVSVCGQKIMLGKTTELEKYVALMKNNSKEFSSSVSVPVFISTATSEVMTSVSKSLIPTKAAHLKPQTEKKVFDMFPFVIKHDEDAADPDSRETLEEKIRQINLHSGCIENKNDELHTAEAMYQLADPKTDIRFRYFDKDATSKTYIKVPETFREIQTNEEKIGAIRSMPGCGVAHDEKTEMNAWIFRTNKYAKFGFPKGTIILQVACDVPASSLYMSTTTGKEAFTSKREDETENVGNGTFAVKLSAETAKSVEKMQSDLDIIVKMSLEICTDAKDRRITSLHTSAGWQSIMVNDEVKTGLSKGGTIFKHIREKYGVTLKLKGKQGRPTAACKDSGLNLLCEISW